MGKGKLIVIEGTDGSGKGTQLALLVNYFKSKHTPYATLDFPQYYKTFFGRWLGRFLKGEFGSLEGIPPYLFLFPFAADRWQEKKEMERWLDEGRIVLINRYTASNAAYQAAKLPKTERRNLIDWSFKMEYEAFGIPKEDLVLFLYVPFAASQKLIEAKGNRKYLGNGIKKDIHESNEKLMRDVETVYLDFCSRFPHWVKIDCTEKGQILPKEVIHQKILEALKKRKIIS